MDKKTKETMLAFQQSEANGALMYRRLSEEFSDGEAKSKLLEMAKDEGRHAAAFHSITQKPVAPQTDFAENMAREMARSGIPAFFKKVSDAEYKAADAYSPYCEDFPILKTILPDEEKHGRFAAEIAGIHTAN